jgi:hypothetical protein
MFRRFLIALLAMVLFTGCSATSASSPEKEIQSVDDLTTLLQSHMSGAEIQPKDILVTLLRLDPDSIIDARAAFEKGDTGKLAIVILAKDNDAALEAGDRLNYYLSTLQNSAAQYNTNALEMIRNGYIYTRDNVTILVISDDMDAVKAELAEYFS